MIDPPEDPELEISDVLCVSVACHHGTKTIIPILGDAAQSGVGAFCMEYFGEVIQDKVWEAANEAAQDDCNPHDERI